MKILGGTRVRIDHLSQGIIEGCLGQCIDTDDKECKFFNLFIPNSNGTICMPFGNSMILRKDLCKKIDIVSDNCVENGNKAIK